MNSIEILKEYDKYTAEWMEKEAKLANFIDKWLYKEMDMTASEVQEVFNTTIKQVEAKRLEANQTLSKYLVAKNKEVSGDYFSTSISYLAKQHEKDAFKPFEEKNNMTQSEIERGRQIYNIKLRVMRKEINMAKAEELRDIVDNTYGINNVTEESVLEMLNGLKF